MAILTCPACDGRLNVPAAASGLVHCPSCKELVGVPQPRSSGRRAAPARPSEGVTPPQLIAAAIAGVVALCFFFFSCCGGLWIANLFSPRR